MKIYYRILLNIFLAIFLLTNTINVYAQNVAIGNGSYTTNFPGTDAAGRNSFPSGTPQLSGAAIGKPVPTNDWWSYLIKNDHASNLFNYPMALKTKNSGLVVSYIPWGVFDDQEPIIVGVTGLNASKAKVSNYSDWTVTMDFDDNTRKFEATSGIGMPFLYFNKQSADVAQIQVNLGTVTISGEMLIVANARNNADFVFYAPTGSTWTQSGNTYSSTLNGKNYWSMAMIPLTATNINTVAEEYKKYAYVFPVNTSTTWTYNENSSVLRTDFLVETDTKEGTQTKILMGLLPHQWANLTSDSPQPDKYSYSSVRGELKTMEGNSFSVENTFKGILPTLPYLANYSEGFSPSELNSKIAQIENDGLSTWTDSYNEGQVMNRLIQTARIADETGNIVARDKMVATVKERLEDWLKAESSEVAFLFYYNSDWSTLIGYPAGHGQDGNINDHHFHWGYFIHAAAFLEQYEPGWANEWGEMINHLVRDAASSDRNDTKFPYLRSFSPYAGHCWANGFATFPQGNDQESTSESMQFNSSLIHWGTITGNDEIRDLGIYLYTTEQTAIEEYWFDMYERNFLPTQQYSLVSRVWGNSYDNGTFWTADIAASYGIEMYPIHGGSFYLGHNTDYVQKLWNEITANTGILSNQVNPNLWHDVKWEYLAFIDPEAAIALYDSYPERELKFGISDAQTYYWLHNMNALGKVNSNITANYPIATAFNDQGTITYAAHNYSNEPVTVTFSDGFTLDVAANKMATNRDIAASGVLTSDFDQAFTNGSVNLSVAITGNGVTKVEFFDGSTSIGEKTSAPYTLEAANLSLGIHGMFAKVFINGAFSVTNIVPIQVGEQVPYLGSAFIIPGMIEPGYYDKFEGGVGQGISYVDVSQNNEGGFRPEEYVDAITNDQEGSVVGWFSAGEWMEYTIDVQTSGLYDLTLRYASGNTSGGGPFYFEIDGIKVSPDVTLPSTSDWNSWSNKVVNNIELTKGEHVLRLMVLNGEFNMGKMTFTYKAALGYNTPTADAGVNISVTLPATSTTLDGSLSSHPDNLTLTYDWEQIYGPSIVNFADNTLVNPEISNLKEGVYKIKLTVSDGSYTSNSFVLVIVSITGNFKPTVNITSPANNATFSQGTVITINASAQDLDGTITLVEFFDGATKLGEDNTLPYSFVYANAALGAYELTAKATDNSGEESTSQVVNISIEELMTCAKTGTQAEQGSFSVGYTSTFQTVGTNVIITFELLDTDKAGVVAYLWKQSPFTETQMTNVSGNVFTATIGGQNMGSSISYACKFAYAGGLSATAYINYVVGSTCMVTSAALSDLKVDGTTIDGFDANTLNYAVALPEGTTIVPTITATTKNPAANATITAATAIPGTTEIVVISEDATITKTYTVAFNIASRDDASLSDLKVDGTTIAGFNANTLIYTVELPKGTTTVPSVTATTNDTGATAVITAATAIPGTTEIAVTSADASVITTYSVTFRELDGTNATLSDLKVDGTTIVGFNANTLSYSVELPAGTTAVPSVTATTNDAAATVIITAATAIPGTTEIEVTSEDASITNTYSVAFIKPSKANQTIIFDDIQNISLDSASITLAAEASSGLIVNFSSGSDKISIDGFKVSLVAAGRVSIVANQAGNEDFEAATPVEHSFCINPIKPIISTSNMDKETITLTSSSDIGNQWYFNGGFIANAQFKTYEASTIGNYTVKVRVNDCVSPFSDELSLIVTGVNELDKGISVYPNPTHNTLKLTGINDEILDYKLFDLSGKNIPMLLLKNNGVYTSDISNLNDGVYFLKVEVKTLSLQFRIIKN